MRLINSHCNQVDMYVLPRNYKLWRKNILYTHVMQLINRHCYQDEMYRFKRPLLPSGNVCIARKLQIMENICILHTHVMRLVDCTLLQSSNVCIARILEIMREIFKYVDLNTRCYQVKMYILRAKYKLCGKYTFCIHTWCDWSTAHRYQVEMFISLWKSIFWETYTFCACIRDVADSPCTVTMLS